jgi:hypothetical protein
VQALPARRMHCVPLGGGKKAYDSLRRVRNSGGPLGYAYRDLENLQYLPEQPSQMVIFDPEGAGLRPSGEYLVGTVHSSDGGMDELVRSMSDYADCSLLEFKGPAYAVYLPDAAGISGEEEYLLQISVRVRPK